MSDENKDGAESEKSDDMDDPEVTSSIFATTISSAGIKRSKKIKGRNYRWLGLKGGQDGVGRAERKWQDVSWISREKGEVWRTVKERRKAADDADVVCICSPMQSPTWHPCTILAYISTICSSTTVLPRAWRNRWFLISEQCGRLTDCDVSVHDIYLFILIVLLQNVIR